MTYIRNFDPEWHAADPQHTYECPACLFVTNLDDCQGMVTETATGTICPACGTVTWDQP